MTLARSQNHFPWRTTPNFAESCGTSIMKRTGKCSCGKNRVSINKVTLCLVTSNSVELVFLICCGFGTRVVLFNFIKSRRHLISECLFPGNKVNTMRNLSSSNLFLLLRLACAHKTSDAQTCNL